MSAKLFGGFWFEDFSVCRDFLKKRAKSAPKIGNEIKFVKLTIKKQNKQTLIKNN